MLKSIESETARKRVGNDASDETRDAPARRGSRRIAVLFGRAVMQTVIAGGILAGAVFAYFHLVETRPEVPTRPQRERVYVVRTAPVDIGTEQPTLSLFGEVVAARTVELRALVAGKIIEVNDNLNAGSSVDTGDPLVSIDPFAYEGALVEARANLAEARARLIEAEGGVAAERGNVEFAREQLEFAERDLERGRTLRERGSVTERTVDDRALVVSQRRQQLDQRQAALAVEEAQVEQQKAAVERAEWRLTEAQQNLQDTTLTAPFDAVVRSENAEVGRLVNVNDVIAVLYNRDALEARFTLSDNQYGRLIDDEGTLFGREVELIWYIGNEPVTYSATIERVGADVASERGGVDVYARIESRADATPLRPGAFVELRVPDKRYRDVARLPETALYGGNHVYAVVDDRLVRRTVAVIAYEGGDVIVRGDLADGETVITTQISEVGEGLLVREEGAPPPRGGGERGERAARSDGETAGGRPAGGERRNGEGADTPRGGTKAGTAEGRS